MLEEQQDHTNPTLSRARACAGGSDDPEAPWPSRRRPCPFSEPRPHAPPVTVIILNRDEDDEAARPPAPQDMLACRGVDEELEEGEILREGLAGERERSRGRHRLQVRGIIPLSEFADHDSIKVGEEVDVFLEKMENQDGLVVLSKQRADFVKVWDRVKERGTGRGGRGSAGAQDQGGAVVDLFGVEAFLPGARSLCGLRNRSNRSWTRRSSSRSSS